jgi:hypothetical protein
MNCYNHQNIAAVGLCKCCSKGLCPECAVDLGHGLACKNMHEGQVETLNMIIEKNAKAYAAAPSNSIIAPIFSLFMGLVFAGYGLFSGGGVTGFSFVLGTGFVIYSLVVFFRNRALFGNTKSA